MNNRAQITISADNQAGRGIDQARRDLGELGNAADRAGSRTKKSFHEATVSSNSFSGSVSKLYASMAGLAALIGAGAIARGFIETAAAMERTTVMLEGLEGSAQKARESMTWLMDFAGSAPYQLSSLSDTFVKLRTAGLDPTAGSMQALVDAVAAFGGTNLELQRAAVAIQQMAGKGVISMEEMRQQLGEAVPDALKVMAREMDMTMMDLSKLISDGALDATTGLNALFEGWKKEHAGAAAAFAGTMSGLWNQIKLQYELFKYDMMNSGDSFVVLKAALKTTLDLIKKWREDGSIVDWSEYAVKAMGAVAQGAVWLGKAFLGWQVIWEGLKVAFDSVQAAIWKSMSWLGDKLAGMLDKLGWVQDKLGFDEAAEKTREAAEAMQEWADTTDAAADILINDIATDGVKGIEDAVQAIVALDEKTREVKTAFEDNVKAMKAHAEAGEKATSTVTEGIRQESKAATELETAMGNAVQSMSFSMDDLAFQTETTTSEISRQWDHMFERLQDLTADWLKDWEIRLDSLKDLAKSVAAQIASYWIWGDQSKGFSFANMFGGSMLAEAGGNAVAPALQTAGMTGSGGGFNFGGSLASLGTSAMQGLGNVGTWMQIFPTNLTASVGSFFSDIGFSSGASFMGGMNSFFANHLGLSGGLTAGLGTFLLTGLTTGDWGAAAMSGGGAAAGAALGTAIFPGIGTVLGGILGGIGGSFLSGLFGGDGKKRSGFYEQVTYGSYSSEGGWGAPEEEVLRRKRNYQQFEESVTDLVSQSVDWVNSIDSMFKGLLGTFGGDYKTLFTQRMTELATTSPSMIWGIDAQDEGEVQEWIYRDLRRLGENLIGPIVQEGQQLLAQALDDSISESSIWGYFTDSMQTHIRTSLHDSLEDLQVDWSKVVDEESFNAAIEQMQEAGESVNEIINYFNQIGAVMDDLAQRIALHDYSGNVQSAVMELDSINSEFQDLALTLQALGVDLEKYTDLQEAYNLAIQDWLNQAFAGAISYAGTSAGWQAMAPQSMSSTDQWLAQYQHVQDLTSSYDGTTASAIELSDALGVLSGMSYDLAAELKNAIDSIHQSYTDTIEQMKLDTMSDQQKYDYAIQQASELETLLPTLTDPAAIKQTMDDILHYSGLAWGLLSEDQQKLYVGQFTSFLEGVEDKGVAQLEAIGKAMDNANKGLIEELRPLLAEAVTEIKNAVLDFKIATDKQITAADKQDAAADGQVAAANAQISAAGTPVTVTVNLDSSDVG
jgi:tape measure domain-containing protein